MSSLEGWVPFYERLLEVEFEARRIDSEGSLLRSLQLLESSCSVGDHHFAGA